MASLSLSQCLVLCNRFCDNITNDVFTFIGVYDTASCCDLYWVRPGMCCCSCRILSHCPHTSLLFLPLSECHYAITISRCVHLQRVSKCVFNIGSRTKRHASRCLFIRPYCRMSLLTTCYLFIDCYFASFRNLTISFLLNMMCYVQTS